MESEDELRGLRAAGKVVRGAIEAMRAAVEPGVRTRELDAIAGKLFAAAGARSGPQLDYDFPGVTCISVNEQAVHGIPSGRKLKAGDLVKLDVTAELAGFYADACATVPVGAVSPEAAALIDSAEHALAEALAIVRAGVPLHRIGRTVEDAVRARGHDVCSDLMGHGIGRRIHEEPDVPSVYLAELDQPLAEGLVITIEPIIAAGDGAVRQTDDGWTIRTRDRSLSAHAEHTLVVRRGQEPILLTA